MSAEIMNESEIVYRDRRICLFFGTHDYPIPLIKYKDGKTCVFWDVEDYPIPDRHDPLWMKNQIEKALKHNGYCGEISIQAYVDKNTSSPELEMKYSDANIKLDTLSEGSETAKAASMVVDVVFWAYDNHYKSNLIVLSKKLGKERSILDLAEGVFDRGYCILLSTTRPGWYGPSQTETLFLTSLFDGESPSGSLDNNKRKREDTFSKNAQGNPTFTVSAAAASNMERLFPKGDRSSSRGRDTLVLLDIDSFDQIPKDPYKIQDHIRSVLKKEGYYGWVSFEVVVADENRFPDDLLSEYEQADFFVPAGRDKDANIYLVLITLLYWAFNSCEEPGNLLVVSESTNFGQGKFPAIRQSMEKNGLKVAVTQLEPVMKLEGLPIPVLL